MITLHQLLRDTPLTCRQLLHCPASLFKFTRLLYSWTTPSPTSHCATAGFSACLNLKLRAIWAEHCRRGYAGWRSSSLLQRHKWSLWEGSIPELGGLVKPFIFFAKYTIHPIYSCTTLFSVTASRRSSRMYESMNIVHSPDRQSQPFLRAADIHALVWSASVVHTSSMLLLLEHTSGVFIRSVHVDHLQCKNNNDTCTVDVLLLFLPCH